MQQKAITFLTHTVDRKYELHDSRTKLGWIFMESGISWRKIRATWSDDSAISQASGNIAGSHGMREWKFAKRHTEVEYREAAGSEEHADRDGGSTYQTLSAVHECVGRDSRRV